MDTALDVAFLFVEEAEVLLVVKTRYEAIRTGNSDLLSSLISEQYLYITAHGAILNKIGFVAGFTECMQDFSSAPRVCSLQMESKVTATVVTEVEGLFTIAGRQQHGKYRSYHTLIKSDSDWKFLAGHYA